MVNEQGQDYATMAAGRDMDALIAEKVFGWRRDSVGRDADGLHGGTEVLVPPEMGDDWWRALPLKGSVHLGHFTPRWSTDFVTAWTLVERYGRMYGNWREVAFRNELAVLVGGAWPEALYKLTPLAICRAALASAAIGEATGAKP